ncbi:aminotransferase class I/II-fold pyridoxal phosphate-dependent enzyme [Alkalibaculum sp. M08DMB]|uniref:Aminotransferase class I/II-fold pyridoxal phosphate-dependent enzyme n=1 Tax=Alkalibaculum sporogenes TaxID=2655001 RepID=A0A6A7K806_9FIRM|nr:aminotransferase class I/II-fold pyridoxal phosphate-dependent enzyme [Alkalibaculum sporogenes]MPW25347.1 aminotransferase class I/II-fold pyridoxal phosphate-dependent enzyme [Alkalibaculum sporogenes]
MRSTIYNTVEKIINKDGYTRLHMPGHKGISEIAIDWHKFDITEVPGCDNLSNPNDLLLHVMDQISHIFETKKSFMLVNGSTVGIIASILAICRSGDSFIIPRNSHRSVYSAFMLQDIEPIYIYPSIYLDKIFGCIQADEVEIAFKENPNCKGIIITSPSYHGVCSNISKISEVSKKYGKILIVDEAHGAHLKFNKSLPLSSVDLGADIVVQSTHKTLSSFNQGALLHVCSDKVNLNIIRQYLNMLQTSSPSYPIMMSIESAVKYAFKNGQLIFDKIIGYHNYIEKELLNSEFIIKGTGLTSCCKVFDYDRSKIWIESNSISGHLLSKLLREKYNIQIEMWDQYSILAMMGIGTQEIDIKRLVIALKEIALLEEYKEQVRLPKNYIYPKVDKSMNFGEVIRKDKELVSLKRSVGRISSDFIIPYPPGIPIIVPGEIISWKIIERISDWSVEEIVGLTRDREVYVTI